MTASIIRNQTENRPKEYNGNKKLPIASPRVRSIEKLKQWVKGWKSAKQGRC
jgi:hypothetical protein